MKSATSTIQGLLWQFRHDHAMRHRVLCVLLVLSLVVGVGVFYSLRHTALTLAGDADCGFVEHVHSQECEDAGYTCGFAADYEHVHTIDCYADELADVETAAEWEAALEPARSELSGAWAADVVTIAQTQLGYAESTANWQLDEEGQRQGYTRFGAWYGSPYVEWSSAFASFCLSYAGIGEDVLPFGSGAHSWSVALDEDGLYAQAADHAPQVGDVAFIDTDADSQADRAGIVAAVVEDGAITTIEGDVDGAVAEVAYPADAATTGRTDEAGEPLATILGYLPTSEVQAAYDEYQQEQAADDPATNPNDGISLAVSSAFDQTVSYQAWREGLSSNFPASIMIYVSSLNDTSNKTVAYCYNASKTLPTYSGTAGNSPTSSSSATSPYYRASDASENVFKTEAAGWKTYSSEWIEDSSNNKTLKNTVLSIVYNGYPNDESDLLSENSTYTVGGKNIYQWWNTLSLYNRDSYYNNDINQFFYQATQVAIWHFTDGYSYSAFYDSTATTDARPLAGYAAEIIYNAAVARKAPLSYKLDLFSSGSTSGDYQDLLSATSLDPSYEGEIVARKTVTLSTDEVQPAGSMSNTTGAFTFVVKDEDGNVIATATNDEEGTVRFTVPVDELGTLYTYTVEESASSSGWTRDTNIYTVTFEVTEESKTVISSFETSAPTGNESSASSGIGARSVTLSTGATVPAYCINSFGAYNAQGSYGYIVDPTDAQILASSYATGYTPSTGSTLAEDLKKVVYFFSTTTLGSTSISYTDSTTNTSRTYTFTNNNSGDALIRYMTGNSENWTSVGFTGETQAMDVLAAILASTDASSQKLVLLTGAQETDNYQQQPLVLVMPTSSTSTDTTTTVTQSEQSSVPSFNNTQTETARLMVQKDVSGEAAETSRLFTFTVSVSDSSGAAVSGTYPVTCSSTIGTSDSNYLTQLEFVDGSATVYLAGGQYITIDGLPQGFFYTVTEAEANQDGYTTTSEHSTNVPDTGEEGAGVSDSAQAYFSNTREEEPTPAPYSATIMAKKTIDGANVTDGKTFTFLLQEDLGDGTFSAGEQATTDATTGIATWTLSYSTTGTHTYRITEVNTGDYATIDYNTEASETVVVTVADASGGAVGSGEGETLTATGSYLSGVITVTSSSGATTRAYSIDRSGSTPSGRSYSLASDTEAALAAKAIDASKIPDLKILLYAYELDDLSGGTTYSADQRQGMMNTLIDPTWYSASSYSALLNAILTTVSAPDDYALAVYTTDGYVYPPLIAGYTATGGTTVTYGGDPLTDTNLPTINNTTRAAYTMPETGGVDTAFLYLFGTALVAGSCVGIGRRLLRKRERGYG